MSKTIFQMLDGLHGEIYINSTELMRTEATADERQVRASLFESRLGRVVPDGEWHAVSSIDGRQVRYMTLTNDRSALVHLVDTAIKSATKKVIEACILERAVMPSLPFALFALDHADGRNDDEYAPAVLELWDASTEQRNARRAQARALMHWARWAP